MRVKNGWYDRLEIEKISKSWVEQNCRITKRELELLEIINSRKLVRRDMLEVISPSYRNLGINRTKIINKSIRKLYDMFCIDKTHEKKNIGEGNKPAVVALDKAGSIILGVKHKQRIRHDICYFKDKKYTQRVLPSNISHINGVNNLEVETILCCDMYKDIYINDWVIESPISLFYGNEKVTLIPDIQMTLKHVRIDSEPFYAYIEYDTGSEDIRCKEPKTLIDKIIKYRKYKLSGLWKNYYKNFPMVILVTEDDSRTTFFNSKCKELGVSGYGIYADNYKDFLVYIYDNILKPQSSF